MSTKQVFQRQWDYRLNCNENENDNEKIDHINKTLTEQGVDIETIIQNIASLGKTIPLPYFL